MIDTSCHGMPASRAGHAKSVTHVSEHLLPMSPVHTPSPGMTVERLRAPWMEPSNGAGVGRLAQKNPASQLNLTPLGLGPGIHELRRKTLSAHGRKPGSISPHLGGGQVYPAPAVRSSSQPLSPG